MAYDVRSYQSLGPLYKLLSTINADSPTEHDIKTVEQTLLEAIASTKDAATDLSFRLQTDEAINGGRAATLKVREMLRQQW